MHHLLFIFVFLCIAGGVESSVSLENKNKDEVLAALEKLTSTTK